MEIVRDQIHLSKQLWTFRSVPILLRSTIVIHTLDTGFDTFHRTATPMHNRSTDPKTLGERELCHQMRFPTTIADVVYSNAHLQPTSLAVPMTTNIIQHPAELSWMYKLVFDPETS